MTSPDAELEPPDEPGQPDAPAAPDALVPSTPAAGRLLPDQSPEDTDAAWGDYRERERDDDRLYRDRPPHWDDI